MKQIRKRSAEPLIRRQLKTEDIIGGFHPSIQEHIIRNDGFQHPQKVQFS